MEYPTPQMNNRAAAYDWLISVPVCVEPGSTELQRQLRKLKAENPSSFMPSDVIELLNQQDREADDRQKDEERFYAEQMRGV